MKLEKAFKRDKKFFKGKYGLKVDGKGIFLIVGILKDKADKVKGKK